MISIIQITAIIIALLIMTIMYIIKNTQTSITIEDDYPKVTSLLEELKKNEISHAKKTDTYINCRSEMKEVMVIYHPSNEFFKCIFQYDSKNYHDVKKMTLEIKKYLEA